MAEESSAAFLDRVKELLTQNEARMKTVQEQIAGQWDTQHKAIADLVEGQWNAQQKAISDLIEQGQDQTAKIADRGISAQGDRRSGRAAVERAAEVDLGLDRDSAERPKEGHRGCALCARWSARG